MFALLGGTRAICRFLKGVEAVELDGAVGVVAQPRRKQGKLRRTQEQTNEEGQPRATSRAARSRTARSLQRGPVSRRKSSLRFAQAPRSLCVAAP